MSETVAVAATGGAATGAAALGGSVLTGAGIGVVGAVGAVVVACAGVVVVGGMAVYGTYKAIDNEITRQADAAKKLLIDQATEAVSGIKNALSNCNSLGSMAETCTNVLKELAISEREDAEMLKKAVTEKHKECEIFARESEKLRKAADIMSSERLEQYAQTQEKLNKAKAEAAKLNGNLAKLQFKTNLKELSRRDFGSGLVARDKNEDDRYDQLLKSIKEQMVASETARKGDGWLKASDEYTAYQTVYFASRCFSEKAKKERDASYKVVQKKIKEKDFFGAADIAGKQRDVILKASDSLSKNAPIIDLFVKTSVSVSYLKNVLKSEKRLKELETKLEEAAYYIDTLEFGKADGILRAIDLSDMMQKAVNGNLKIWEGVAKEAFSECKFKFNEMKVVKQDSIDKTEVHIIGTKDGNPTTIILNTKGEIRIGVKEGLFGKKTTCDEEGVRLLWAIEKAWKKRGVDLRLLGMKTGPDAFRALNIPELVKAAEESIKSIFPDGEIDAKRVQGGVTEYVGQERVKTQTSKEKQSKAKTMRKRERIME